MNTTLRDGSKDTIILLLPQPCNEASGGESSCKVALSIMYLPVKHGPTTRPVQAASSQPIAINVLMNH